MPGYRQYNRAGFTLVEMLVAVLIITTVLSAIYGAFRAGTQSTTLLEEHTDINDTARILFDQLNREIDGICRPSGGTSIALVGKSSDSDGNSTGADYLEFTTTDHNPCSSSDIHGDTCTVTYMVKYDNDGTPLGLYLSEDFYPGLHSTDTDTDLPVTRLSDLVVAMSFSYLDSDSEEWADEWVDETNPPAAIRIKLALKPSRKDAKSVIFTETINVPTRLNTSTSSSSSTDTDSTSGPGTITATTTTGGPQ